MSLPLLFRLLRIALPIVLLLVMLGLLGGRLLRADAPLLSHSIAQGGQVMAYIADPDYRLRQSLGGEAGLVNWSPQGDAGLLYTWPTTAIHLQLIDRHGRPRGEIARSDSVALAHAAWSPDGRAIAYLTASLPEITDGAELLALYHVEIPPHGPPGFPQQLAVHRPRAHVQVAWRPGASQIAYTTRDELRLVDLVTGEDRVLVAESVLGGVPVWSPDGRWLAYSTADALLLMEMDASAHPLRTERYDTGFDPVWSPDGSRLSYNRVIPETFVTSQLVVVDIATGEAQQLTDHAAGSVYSALWSPAGDRLFYTIAGRDPSTGVPIRAVNLISATGGAPRSLPDSQVVATRRAWSADGGWLALTSLQRGSSVEIVLVDTGSLMLHRPFEGDQHFIDAQWMP